MINTKRTEIDRQHEKGILLVEIKHHSTRSENQYIYYWFAFIIKTTIQYTARR